MSKIILDTCFYIDFLSRGIEYPPEIIPGQLYLSAVVLEELYAGAHSAKSVFELDSLYHTAQKAGRLVAPSLSDWIETGKILAKIARKFGFEEIGRGRMTNDVLIALSAKQCGARLYTKNAVDFQRVHHFLHFEYLVIK